MKDGNVAKFFEFALDFEATGCGYVFEIYSAETCAYVVNRRYDFVNVLRFYADGDCVDSRKFVKQNALAFHNGHTCFRAYVPEPQNRASVRDDGNGVPTPRERVGKFLVLFYRKARGGNAGGVGKRQVLLVFHFCSRYDFEFAFPLVMLLQRFFGIVHIKPRMF